MTNEKLIAKLKLLPLRAEVKLVADGAEASIASISWSDQSITCATGRSRKEKQS